LHQSGSRRQFRVFFVNVLLLNCVLALFVVLVDVGGYFALVFVLELLWFFLSLNFDLRRRLIKHNFVVILLNEVLVLPTLKLSDFR